MPSIYNYTDGALYRLFAAPQEVSDIALQPGESLLAISAGDTSRWVVSDTTSGNGATKQVHILAKPYASDLKTNLVITTDHRSYHLELQSTTDTFMAAVSWNYRSVQPRKGLRMARHHNGKRSSPCGSSLNRNAPCGAIGEAPSGA